MNEQDRATDPSAGQPTPPLNRRDELTRQLDDAGALLEDVREQLAGLSYLAQALRMKLGESGETESAAAVARIVIGLQDTLDRVHIIARELPHPGGRAGRCGAAPEGLVAVRRPPGESD
ncbi:MAG: hypothetical protein ACOCTI_06680 [Phycisphaeraceae bacterium]